MTPTFPTEPSKLDASIRTIENSDAPLIEPEQCAFCHDSAARVRISEAEVGRELRYRPIAPGAETCACGHRILRPPGPEAYKRVDYQSGVCAVCRRSIFQRDGGPWLHDFVSRSYIHQAVSRLDPQGRECVGRVAEAKRSAMWDKMLDDAGFPGKNGPGNWPLKKKKQPPCTSSNLRPTRTKPNTSAKVPPCSRHWRPSNPS